MTARRLAALALLAAVSIASASENPLARSSGPAGSVLEPVCTGVDAGTYTPEPIWTSNLAQVSGRDAHWTRIGPIVSVAGAVALVAEQPGRVQIHLPPPIPTPFGSHFQAAGVMTARSGAAASVLSVPDTEEVRLEYLGPGALVNDNVRYAYTYRIAACP